MGIVSEYIRNLIAKQVNDNGIVVWYDPEGAYFDPEAQINNMERFHESMACSISFASPDFGRSFF